jgi:signal transduction histidine kinase
MSIVTTSTPSSSGSNEETSAVAERTARRCAETALFMRDHVLSLVSHDLRSPLNAIHSWAYVLDRKIDTNDATAQRALEGIRNGVEQQVKLLESIVDTTRAETKALVLKRAPIADVRDALAVRRGVALELNSPLAAQKMDGDRERLAAALWLLVAFAVEASASGATVTLDADVDASTFRATVAWQATPAALTDAALPHVLENFARASDAAARSQPHFVGTRTVQAHRGSA